MAAPFRLVVFCLVILVFGLGLHDFLTNFESNQCEMTYMYVTPEYLKITLDTPGEQYPQYGLYFYGEGQYAREHESSGFKMSGIPVLFIPGNAGSHRQVRSLASVALKKHQDGKTPFHFNYFSIDYNGELSGLYGGVLQKQTEFAHLCIKKILSLYKGATSPPKSVMVVGHSMGGMIARALFTLPDFKTSQVQTIITQATPHQAPVVSLDLELAQFYEQVNSYWRNNNKTLADVTVVSTGGGHRDILVRSGLSALTGIVVPSRGVESNTMSVPRGWVSTDHLCSVWCKQMVLATKRAMFDIIDKNTKQMAVSPAYRVSAFKHHFVDNPGAKKFKGAYDKMIPLDKTIKWEMRPKKTWKIAKDKIEKVRYSVMEIPKFQDYSFVAISNIENERWVGACTNRITIDPNDKKAQKAIKPPKKDDPLCKEMGNFAQYSSQIPPLYSEKKVVHIDAETLKEFDYILTILPTSNKRVEVAADLYATPERHLRYNATTVLSFLSGFPSSAMTPEIVIDTTEANAVFYNISLTGLEIPLQAYTAHIYAKKCKETTSGNFAGTVAKLFVPWSQEHTYKYIRPGQHGNISLKLQSGRPEGDTRTAQLHLYLHPQCTYQVSISVAWTELYGQFVRFYGMYLPAFFVIQVFMVLSWQLGQLDEEGIIPSFTDAHARFAQPWRVVPLAVLLRFLIGFPEDDNISMKLGLPALDTVFLSSQNMWYSALPLISYVTAYAVVGIYGFILTAVMAFIGRITSFFCRRCCGSQTCKRLGTYLQYLLFIGGAILSSQVCGSLGMEIVYVLFVFKTISSYVSAHNSQFKVPHAWNRYNINFSLTLLSLMALLLNGAPLVVWAKNLEFSAQLDNDPSKWTGVLMCVAGFLLTYSRFPYIASEFFSICGNLLWVSSILMVLYALTSVYRVSYFIVANLLSIAIPTVFLSLMPVQPMQQPQEEVKGEESEFAQVNGSKVNEAGDGQSNDSDSGAAETTVRRRGKESLN